MSIKALLVTAILGSSTVALAQPVVRDHRDDSSYDNDYDRRVDESYRDRDQSYDDRYDDHRGDRSRFRRRPVVLAQNVVLSSGRDQEPAFVQLDNRLRGISRLQLRLEEGRAYVDSVFVLFDDGHRESIAVDQMISPREPMLNIDLPHGGVTGLYIATSQRNARGGGWRRHTSATVDIVGIIRR
jgi:hypothetical protein